MLLQKLSEAHGVSGREEEVRSIILEEIRGRVDECRVDGVGNLIARKKGTAGSKLIVLVAAHMDEVGLMITLVEDSGLLRFAKVGSIDDRVLPARSVLIGEKRVPGVIGVKPVHLTEPAEREKVMEWEQLAIDIGASSKAEAERLVQRGDCAVFATEYRVLAEAGSAWRTVQGKAFDDRAGCALLAELLKERFPFDLAAAFTVQEEVGLRGARVAAYAENPDAAVALECTGANEVPTKRDVSPSTRLGAGPAITIRDNSFIADPRLVELFTSTARDKSIPCQFKQPNIGGTDAGAIHRARAGVPSITVAVPARYIHSPAAILDLNDFENTMSLAREALHRLPGAISK
ncbi:MAG: M42 family metallopeptidase [Spirochaetia bacterium]|jgi:endoglucanase